MCGNGGEELFPAFAGAVGNTHSKVWECVRELHTCPWMVVWCVVVVVVVARKQELLERKGKAW